MMLGGIIAGNLLPWVLVAPALPLLLVLTRKTADFKLMILLSFLCTFSILSNLFLLMASGSGLHEPFLRVSFFVEILFTILLLNKCTSSRVLKYSIIISLIIFGSVYLSFASLQPGLLPSIMTAGVFIVFLASILVLLSMLNDMEKIIINSPDFWFSAGIFFHFGLLSLLLFTGQEITSVSYHQTDGFSVFYVAIFIMQFLFFATGVILERPWNRK